MALPTDSWSWTDDVNGLLWLLVKLVNKSIDYSACVPLPFSHLVVCISFRKEGPFDINDICFDVFIRNVDLKVIQILCINAFIFVVFLLLLFDILLISQVVLRVLALGLYPSIVQQALLRLIGPI